MIISIKSLIIHPFLLAIFPVLYIFAYEIEAPANYLVLLILSTSGVILVFLIFLRWLFNDSLKSGMVLSFLLILFIAYGFLHTKLFGLEIGYINIGSHSSLIIPFSIILVLGIYFLIKTKKKLNKISTIFNFVSIVLIVSVIFFVAINNIENPEIYNNEKFDILSLPNVGQTNFPDIYYIILDEYAGSVSLQNNFNFDNSEFYSALSERGFNMPSTSFSNYPYTMLSVPSTLNMQYLNFLGEELGTESTDTSPIVEILENNLVMKNLDEKGYHIVSFYAGTDAIGSTRFVDEKLCGEEHFLNQLKGIIIRFIPISFFQPIESYHDKRDEILCTFSEIPKVKDKISQPIFVYAHMAIPHSPYVFDADGNSVTLINKTTDLSTKKKFYLEQLKFTNKKIIETVDVILSKSEKPPIILIQSDHGERTGIDWDNPTKEMLRQGFNNLNAYYFPDDSKNSLYDSITPVNSFRIIFNEYFNADFELLDDKYYWIVSDKRPYDLKDVTEILRG